MTRHSMQQLLRLFVLACAVGSTQCRVDKTLDDQLWTCDESSECGEQDGKPMTCWQGYCMTSCDPENPPDELGVQCIDGGVLLHDCDPGPAGDKNPNNCPAELDCFRTDLLYAKGVCVPFPVCSALKDCPDDEPHTVCASDILAARFEGLPLQFDNLSCVQLGCQDGMSNCAAGTRCLGTTYMLEGNDYPDICVPLCDSQGACPPNYACARTAAAPGADRICVPGLPGVRCTGDLDCIVGSCVGTDAGFGICTLPCDTHEFCQALGTSPSYFRCVEPTPGAPKVCVDSTPFQGPQCDVADDVMGDHCPTGTECFHYSPYLPSPRTKGECRVPCDDEGHCPVRGGLAHVCLDNPDNLESGGGGCYPGNFGLPCQDSSECLYPLSCEAIESDGREVYPSAKICTIPCAAATDAEGDTICEVEPATRDGGYCGDGFCRQRALPDMPCERGEQCRSLRCMNGHCLE
ncbi:MAG TPA: hypothetical protein VMS65_05905 [Polyangiaceae bacterium]|nr:hypothetical protein [Polyangiaceae bacterium]